MEHQPAKTPLVDLLRMIPKDFRGEWETQWSEDGTATGHAMHPVGREAHEAADRIESLEQEQERAYSVLEMYGIPKERARSLATGIMVFDTRMQREVQSLETQLSESKAAVGELVECLSSFEYMVNPGPEPTSCICCERYNGQPHTDDCYLDKLIATHQPKAQEG